MEIIDDSGDKRYFTIIPNYIMNHSTATDQALYLQMKRYAGEGGKCFASEKLLMEKLGVGRQSLKKSKTYLLKKGWIKLIGTKKVQTKGGEQSIKVYSVSDIWKMNIEHFEPQGVSESTPLDQRGVQNEPKGVSETAPNKNKENKNITDETSASSELSYEKDEDMIPIGEVNRRKAKERGYKGEETNPLIWWAEGRMAGKFTNPLKQKKAISTILHTGYDPEDVRAKWLDLEKDKFWGPKGFDFMTVLSEIGKQRLEKKEEKGSDLPTFAEYSKKIGLRKSNA